MVEKVFQVIVQVKYEFELPSRHPVEVECMGYPKRDWLIPYKYKKKN